jgi:hypothetical protein
MDKLTIKDIEELATIIHHAAERGESGDGYARLGNTVAFRAASALRQLLEERRWRPLAEAKTDGSPMLVYAPAREGLSAMQSVCAYHPDAGFCIDELREPTHFMELPAAPEEENGDV